MLWHLLFFFVGLTVGIATVLFYESKRMSAVKAELATSANHFVSAEAQSFAARLNRILGVK